MLQLLGRLLPGSTTTTTAGDTSRSYNVAYDVALKCFTQKPTVLKSDALCLNPRHYLADLQLAVDKIERLDLEGMARKEIVSTVRDAEAAFSIGDAAKARQLLESCRIRVGKLIVVADYRSDELENSPTWEQIAGIYDDFVVRQAEKITELHGYAERLGLQDASMIREMQVSRLFAMLCVSKAGVLNLGLIEDLNSRFLGSDEHEWQRDMYRALRSLAETPELRQHFYQVKDVNWKSNNLALRALILMVQPDLNRRLADDRDARKLLFMTYITRLRQGPVGLCFADAVGISIQHAARTQYLRDLRQIICSGGVERVIDGKRELLTPTMTIADDALDQKLFVHGDSVSLTEDGPCVKIWQVQGLVAAGRLLNKKPEDLAKYLDGLDAKQITANEFILRLSQGNAQRAQVASSGFTAQTQNVLLRLWENSLANLAEAKKGDYFRNALLGSVKAGVKPTLDHLSQLFPTATPKALQVFMDTLNGQIELRYNQTLPCSAVAEDGQSHEGGFVLYKRGSKEPVGTPADFKTLVLEALCGAQNKLTDEKIEDAAVQIFSQLFEAVEDKDGHFLRRCFGAFSHQNKVADPLAVWQSLAQSPLWSKTGDSSSAIWEVYLSALGQVPEEHIAPRNAKELLSWTIRQARKLAKRDDFLNAADKDRAYPARVWGVHSFRMLPLMESFAPLVASEADPQLLLKERFDEASSQVASLALSAQSIASIQKVLARYVHEAVPGPKSKLPTVQRYGRELIEWVSSGAHQRGYVEALVLGAILESLPSDQVQPLRDSLVVVFDTNWQEDNENVYFCFFKDPITDKVILGVTNEDKSIINSRNLPPYINGTWQISECPFILEKEEN